MNELEKTLKQLKANSQSKVNNYPKTIYSDDYWIIEILNDNEFNPTIRVSSFKDEHFVDDLELSRQMFEDDELICEVKEICYR